MKKRQARKILKNIESGSWKYTLSQIQKALCRYQKPFKKYFKIDEIDARLNGKFITYEESSEVSGEAFSALKSARFVRPVILMGKKKIKLRICRHDLRA